MRLLSIILAVLLAGLPCSSVIHAADAKPAPTSSGGADTFKTLVAPFLLAHCVKCHGPQKQEGELSLHKIHGDVAEGPDIGHWKTIAELIALGEMPPEGQPRPEAKQSAAVLAWIKAELTRGGEDTADIGRKLNLPGHGNRVDHAALFAADPKQPSASPSRLWRLSPQIYISFVPRVAGKGHKPGQPFSSSSGEGFRDYADLFVVDEPTISQLMRNTSQIAEIQCGLTKPSKPLKEFAPLVNPDSPPTEEQVRAAIRRQFQLAALRDPTEDETARLLGLMKQNVQDSGQVIGAKATLAAILMLPEAFYRFEVGQVPLEKPSLPERQGQLDEHGRRMLAPRELAYAIAFALTDDPPDAGLLAAASSGKLGTRDDVQREVARLLAEKKIAKPRIMRFFDEYFEYVHAADVFKDLGRGQWRPETLIGDTRYLIQRILDADRDVLKQLLTTNESFVNYKLDGKGVAIAAQVQKKPEPPKIDPKTGQPKPAPKRQPQPHDWYNLPEDWEWTAEQPLKLPSDERAGILSQPSWLAAFATNNENHAIRRGKWVRERLLGSVVPDLPISVDAKLPEAPDQTLRERMRITNESYCWQCHQKMNPIGLTFEHYDFVGTFRKAEPVVDLEATAKNVDKKGNPLGPVFRQVPVVADGTVENSGDPQVDGPVKDSVALMHRLADSPRVRQVFVRHAFRYWMGRNETLDDGPTLVRADRAYVDSQGSMNALIASLLTSDAFLYRK